MKKKMVTEIMARVPSAVTLAIGDGANDTDMIKAAHVGVGIAGIEGTAAVNNADYAIGTFAFLHTLLFVHGFWNYHRIAILVNFIFYKAILLAVAAYWFCLDSAFSGQQFFVDSPLQLYNICYTALPIMAIACWDQVLPRDTLSNNPLVYKERKGKAFSGSIFATWVFRSFWHGLVLYFIPREAFRHEVVTADGTVQGLWYWSTTIFYTVAVVPSVLVLFEMHNLSVLHAFAIFSSFGSLFIFTAIMNLLLWFDFSFYGVATRMMTEAGFWLCFIVTISIPLLIELAYRFLQSPLLHEQLREQVVSRLRDPATHAQATLVSVNEELWSAKTQGATLKVRPTSMAKRPSVAAAPRNKFNLLTALFRFKNMTGSNFESAASHRHQDHHQYVPAQLSSRKEGWPEKQKEPASISSN